MTPDLDETLRRQSFPLRSGNDQIRHRRLAIARSGARTDAGLASMLDEVRAVCNLYDVLGVSPAARTLEIKAAFRRLAKSAHPDCNADTTANQRFQVMHLAYRVLCDAEMRADYDRHLQCVRLSDAARPRPAPRWRRAANEVALVTAMVVVLTPVFVLGFKTGALDRWVVMASQWLDAPNPPPTEAQLLADRLRPLTEAAATEPVGPRPAEPPPTETPKGASMSLGALVLAALLPDPAVSADVEGARNTAPADASASQRAPSLTLSADMPRGGDQLPPAPARAANAPSTLADRGMLDQARRLLQQGERYAAEGNIAIARQYFVRAADLGLAVAATKMAETFEADALARRGAYGVKPDPAEAATWRRRASELGAPPSEPLATGARE